MRYSGQECGATEEASAGAKLVYGRVDCPTNGADLDLQSSAVRFTSIKQDNRLRDIAANGPARLVG
jgi:hypothetical protein